MTVSLFPTGTLIAGRYEVIDALGAGGMGSVFKVRDRALNNDIIALKLLHPHQTDNSAAFARMRNEVLVARQLSHENVVRIHDIGDTPEGHTFITMEYVNGVSLRALIGSPLAVDDDRLAFDECVKLLFEVANVLAYAHRMGVIHRDLKPDNILMSAEGQLKLADFGLARSMMMESHLTPAGETVGSAPYMAPEQIRGEELDNRCDIYALGVLGYELVAGRRPYEDTSWFNLLAKHLNDPVPPLPSSITAPAWFHELLGACLSKRREDRPRNADEIAARLAQELRLLTPKVKVTPRLSMRGPRTLTLRAQEILGRTDATGPTMVVAPPSAFKSRSALVPFVIAFVFGVGAFVALFAVHRFWARTRPAAFRHQPSAAATPASETSAKPAAIAEPRPEQHVAQPGSSHLIAAIVNESYDEIDAALKAGDDVNAVDDAGRTALMLAASRGLLQVVIGLAEHGADLNHQDSTGATALLHAIRRRRVKVALELINRGANPTLADRTGSTPILEATETRQLSVGAALLAHGADPNAVDSEGVSARDLVHDAVRPLAGLRRERDRFLPPRLRGDSHPPRRPMPADH